MHNRHSNWIRLGLAVVIVCGLAAFGAARHSSAQAANLLTNPGFEGDYTPFEGDSERAMAPGWSAWNIARKTGESSWVNVKPQYLPSDARARSGKSQEILTFYAIYTGGVFQQVKVAPNTPLKFSAFINVWSTNLDDPERSEQPSRVSVQVGIDPFGGTDGASANVVWGSSQTFYDEFRELNVTAAAGGDTVSVFVRIIFLDPQRHNHVYVDDASLVATSEPVPTTIVQQPTSTPTPSPLPPTFTPTPTATFTPSVPPVATTQVSGPTFAPPTREGTIVPPTREGTTSPDATVVVPTVATRVPTVPGDVDLSGLPGRIEYVVRSGDTVGVLAQRFQSRVEAIIGLNRLREDGLIVVGQRLIIPVPQQPTNTPVVPTVAPTASTGGQTGPSPVDTAVLDGPTVNGIGTYIMQPGDTLAAVARRYRITLEELARLNGIVNPARVVIGQVLAVPGPGNNRRGGTVAPTVIPTVPGTTTGSGRVHIVQPGENLFRIALRYNVPLVTLQRVNGIPNAALIYVGQRIVIP